MIAATRLPPTGTTIVACNLILTVWHLDVLAHLQPGMTATQLALFGVAINVIPLLAAGLLWRHLRLAAWTFAVFFGAVLAIGAFEHFLRAGPNNVFTIANGPWTSPFRVSATLLLIIEVLGCAFGVWAGATAATSPEK